MQVLSPAVCLVVVVLLIGGSAPLGAAQVQGLYEAEVAVSSKEESERNQALGAVLRNVLVKVTGERNPQSHPGVVQAMSRPSRLVEQYRYTSRATETLDESDAGAEVLLLWARFDSRAVDGLIRETGLPSWGKTRPSMLMWLAVEHQSGRSLVGADDSPTITNVLYQAADRRGLPFVVPLMDLVDRSVIGVSDVWAGFPDTIMQASDRYRADTVLLARVYQPNAAEWEARWRLFLDGAPYDWTLRNENLDVMLVEGVNRAADVVAGRFAQAPGGVSEGIVEISVDEIRTLGDYARALVYLQSLDGVTRVDVNGAAGNQVLFSLAIRGGSSAFTQVVELGRTLVSMGAGEGKHFRLLP